MVAVENFDSEAVGLDPQNFDFERFDSEAEKSKIAAERRNSNIAAENFDMIVFVAFKNFGSDCALQVVDISVEVLWILNYYLANGF